MNQTTRKKFKINKKLKMQLEQQTIKPKPIQRKSNRNTVPEVDNIFLSSLNVVVDLECPLTPSDDLTVGEAWTRNDRPSLALYAKY
jgi:hypothetical protein